MKLNTNGLTAEEIQKLKDAIAVCKIAKASADDLPDGMAEELIGSLEWWEEITARTAKQDCQDVMHRSLIEEVEQIRNDWGL